MKFLKQDAVARDECPRDVAEGSYPAEKQENFLATHHRHVRRPAQSPQVFIPVRICSLLGNASAHFAGRFSRRTVFLNKKGRFVQKLSLPAWMFGSHKISGRVQ